MEKQTHSDCISCSESIDMENLHPDSNPVPELISYELGANLSNNFYIQHYGSLDGHCVDDTRGWIVEFA